MATKFRYDYNMIVIGAGAAGLVTSYIAATLKSKVLLIEKHKMGGDCLNTGCVPSKALIRTAKVVHYAQRAKEFGLKSVSVEFDFADVMNRIQDVISKIEPHDSVERYTRLGVECLQGEARIVDRNTVEVNGQRLRTRTIVIATGASPIIPKLAGVEKIQPLTSENIWQLKELPKRLLVLGGGAIGCELAQAFRRLGSEVTLVERSSRILAKDDTAAAELVQKQFLSEGIHLRLQTSALGFEKEGQEAFLLAECQGKTGKIPFDQVLFALGRRANTKGFGLEDLGIELNENGTIKVDPYLATNCKNIFACGDVAGPYQFTHTAAHQAYFTSVNGLFYPITRYIPFKWKKMVQVNYDVIPWATFTDPEVATVGMTEARAQELGVEYETTVYGIDDLDRAIADSEAKGFVKVLTPPGSDRILGATIVSANASENLAEFTAAMKNGFGLNSILSTIHPYPTMSESVKFAAGLWKQKRKPEKALKRLQKFHEWRRK